MQDERKWHALGEESATCRTRAQVFNHGRVTLVYSVTSDPSLTPDSGNVLRVAWEGGNYPRVTDGACPQGCEVHGVTCLCDTEPQAAMVFGSADNLSAADIMDALHIGSAPPEAFAAGVYTRCTSEACAHAVALNVSVFTHRDSGGTLDERTIFRVLRNGSRFTASVPLVPDLRLVAFHDGVRAHTPGGTEWVVCPVSHCAMHTGAPCILMRHAY